MRWESQVGGGRRKREREREGVLEGRVRNQKGFLKILPPVSQEARLLLGLSGITAGGGCCWSVCQPSVSNWVRQAAKPWSACQPAVTGQTWSAFKQPAVVGLLTWWSVVQSVKV